MGDICMLVVLFLHPPVDFLQYTVVVLELSVSCDELSVFFGCGGINLPDGSLGPLPAMDNSAL